MFKACKHALAPSCIAAMILGSTAPVFSADLGAADHPKLVAEQNPWTLSFTTYGWIPWMSGSMGIKGRSFDVQADPSEILGHLDWSTLPAWMSYAEARNGPIGLFNDIVYANIAGSKGFAKELPGPLPTLAGGVSVDYEQAIVEFGGAYEIWSGANPVVSGASSLDLLAGGRYWHQDVTVSASLGPLNADRSGSVDWVDPFIGVRLRQKIGASDSLVLRADVGGFGAGSDSSWQVLATYNWEMRTLCGYLVDGYLGYRALSVDYSQGSGNTEYKYDVLMQGPVIGTTLHF